jgi:hypothetical protein
MNTIRPKLKRFATNSWFWAAIVFVCWITNQSNAFNAAVFIFTVNVFLALTKGFNVPQIDELAFHSAAQVSEATSDPFAMHPGFEAADECDPDLDDPYFDAAGSNFVPGPGDTYVKHDNLFMRDDNKY